MPLSRVPSDLVARKKLLDRNSAIEGNLDRAVRNAESTLTQCKLNDILTAVQLSAGRKQVTMSGRQVDTATWAGNGVDRNSICMTVQTTHKMLPFVPRRFLS
jgi:hypothetical protein